MDMAEKYIQMESIMLGKDGSYHGKGKMVYEDGTVEEGMWVEADFVA